MLFRKKHQLEAIQLIKDQEEDKKTSNQGSVYIGKSETLEKLQKLAGKSENVLLKIRSIFPFDLIPDTVTVDENKVNIIKKYWLGAENVHSILIEDITSVTVNTGPFMASLDIIDSTNIRYPITYRIRNLNIRNALIARSLIQGLIAAKREGVDLSFCENKDVLECLEILGQVKGEANKN